MYPYTQDFLSLFQACQQLGDLTSQKQFYRTRKDRLHRPTAIGGMLSVFIGTTQVFREIPNTIEPVKYS